MTKCKECGQDKAVVIGGMITKTRYHITKKGRNAGKKMAVFILEDLQACSFTTIHQTADTVSAWVYHFIYFPALSRCQQ